MLMSEDGESIVHSGATRFLLWKQRVPSIIIQIGDRDVGIDAIIL